MHHPFSTILLKILIRFFAVNSLQPLYDISSLLLIIFMVSLFYS